MQDTYSIRRKLRLAKRKKNKKKRIWYWNSAAIPEWLWVQQLPGDSAESHVQAVSEQDCRLHVGQVFRVPLEVASSCSSFSKDLSRWTEFRETFAYRDEMSKSPAPRNRPESLAWNLVQLQRFNSKIVKKYFTQTLTITKKLLLNAQFSSYFVRLTEIKPNRARTEYHNTN